MDRIFTGKCGMRLKIEYEKTAIVRRASLTFISRCYNKKLRLKIIIEIITTTVNNQLMVSFVSVEASFTGEQSHNDDLYMFFSLFFFSINSLVLMLKNIL